MYSKPLRKSRMPWRSCSWRTRTDREKCQMTYELQSKYSQKANQKKRSRLPRRKRNCSLILSCSRSGGETCLKMSKEKQRLCSRNMDIMCFSVIVSLLIDLLRIQGSPGTITCFSIYTPAAFFCCLATSGQKMQLLFVLCFEQVLREELPKGPTKLERCVDLPERGLVHHQTSPAKHHQPYP